MAVTPVAPARKWWGITLGTAVAVVGYWLIVAGLVAVFDDEATGDGAVGLTVAGVAVVSLGLLVASRLSGHPRPVAAPLAGLAAGAAAGVLVSALSRDLATGFAAGLGVAGVIALGGSTAHGLRLRWWAAAGVTAWVLALVNVAFFAGVLLAPFLPLPALGAADAIAERRVAAPPR